MQKEKAPVVEGAPGPIYRREQGSAEIKLHRSFSCTLCALYGKKCPEFAFTSPMSEELIVPLAVTSSRKLEMVTVIPD